MSEILKSLSKRILTEDGAIVIDVENSHGSWLVDENGKEYLDCFSQFASQPLGWNHDKLMSRKSELAEAATHKIANSDMYSKNYCEFVEKFSALTEDFKHYFFISGGALAVENALKAAFDWKHQKSGTTQENMDVIHLKEAFHGRSGYTLSLTNNSYNNIKVRDFPKFNWTRVESPANHKENVDELEKTSLSETEEALRKGNVAAIVLETIQGEGGDNHLNTGYLLSLRALADKYDALLVFDEVQTGVGMTGKMWAYQHHNVVPDLMCFGKKTQTCGFCSTDRIDNVEHNVFNTSSRINSTWGGNIVDMVRFSIFSDIIAEENLVSNSAEVGGYFLEELSKIGLKNVRGKGLMIAFDHEDRSQVLKNLSSDLIALTSGQDSIRFRPHLTFSKQDVDFAIDKIKKAV